MTIGSLDGAERELVSKDDGVFTATTKNRGIIGGSAQVDGICIRATTDEGVELAATQSDGVRSSITTNAGADHLNSRSRKQVIAFVEV